MKNNPLRVGELFMVGFQGRDIPQWLRTFESRFGLGGVILFDYSIRNKAYDNNIFDKAQLKELCAAIHALPSRPLIYIDQEGGKVRRLKDKNGYALLPNQYALSTKPLAEKQALLDASYKEMREIGIDFNLAPVIDTHNPDNPSIGKIDRAYAENIEENTLLLNEIARKHRVGLCLKHYPGIGDAIVDSHDELMDLTPFLDSKSEEQFYSLSPKIFTNAMLLSHAFVQQWDKIYPVSMSHIAVNRIRKRVPDALLFTDDLQMQGLQARYSTEEACVKAIAAGVDVLCIGNNLLNEEQRMLEIATRLEAEINNNETMRKNFERAIARIAQRRKSLQ